MTPTARSNSFIRLSTLQLAVLVALSLPFCTTLGGCGKKAADAVKAAHNAAALPAEVTATDRDTPEKTAKKRVDLPAGVTRVTVEGVGFATPESVLHDPIADVYLVSNISGSPLAVDGDGFVSKLDPAGAVLALKWIDGKAEGVELSAPKGSALANDQLYFTDIDHVRIFARATGKQLSSVRVDGSTFLNDACSNEDGDVYVSDTGLGADFKPSGTDAIYRLDRDGKVTAIVKDPSLGRPNGLWFEGGNVRVVTFGVGELYTVGVNGSRHDAIALPKGSLDGIVQGDDARLWISSWAASGIYVGHPSGPFKLAFRDLDSPADLGFDAQRQTLLIPLFKANKVILQKIGAATSDHKPAP